MWSLLSTYESEDLMGWFNVAENDQERVRGKVRSNGSTEYIHIYKDPALQKEAEAARSGHGGHDHVVFDRGGNVSYDSTRLEPSDKDLRTAYGKH